MNDELVSNCCPYCGTAQPEALQDDDYYRCHDCNYFISREWLVGDAEEFLLNDEQSVLCPWCGYPAGMMQSFGEDGAENAVMCDGCSGTLEPDYLVTQAALVLDRNRGFQQRNFWYLAVIIAIVLLLILTSIF